MAIVSNTPIQFQYPYDIATVMLPWRAKLGDAAFEDVITRLADRDRALEDYLRSDLLYTTQFDSAVQTQIDSILAQLNSRTVFAEVTTQQSTNNAGPVDLATVGPSVTVTVGTSGAVVIQGGFFTRVTATGASSAIYFNRDSGTEIISRTAFENNFGGSGGAGITRAYKFTGLSAGSHTFKLQYGSSGGITSDFSGRWILATVF